MLDKVRDALQQASDLLEHAANRHDVDIDPGNRLEDEHEGYVAVNAALRAHEDTVARIRAVAAVLDDESAGYDALVDACCALCQGYRIGDADDEARAIIARARRALGHDLRGSSLVDLLADNLPLPLDEIRRVLVRIGERREA